MTLHGTLLTIPCAGCGRIFQKALSNYNAIEKRGGKHYHSKDCALKDRSVKVELTCTECGKTFSRAKRSCRKSRQYAHVFCSLHCKAVFKNKSRRGNSTSRRDNLSKFRSHLTRARMHSKQKGLVGFSLTLEDLQSQWEHQRGICPYTGWILTLQATTCARIARAPDVASLDRINPKQGYAKGNVQFVAMMANYAKNDFSEEELINFCKAVALHRSTEAAIAA